MMQANNFIQKHGVDKAREVVEGAPRNAVYYWQIPRCKHGVYSSLEQNQGRAIVLEELKRLVESVDLVSKNKGLEHSKYLIEQCEKHECWKIGDRITGKQTCTYDELKQAIADYEQLFGNTERLGGEHV